MKYAKKKKNNQPLVILLAAAIVLLLVAIAAVVILENRDQPSELPTDPAQVETAGNAVSDPEQTQGSVQTGAAGQSDAPVQTDGAGQPTATTAPAGSGETAKPGSNPGQTAVEPSKPGKPSDGIGIDTDYGTLYFPQEWEHYLAVDVAGGEPYAVHFFAKLDSGKTQALFTIRFDVDPDKAIGAVTTQEGKNVPVGVDMADFAPDESWDDGEKSTVYSMMDAVNEVLTALLPDGKVLSPGDYIEDMPVETPHGILHYPKRWEDNLKLVHSEKTPYSVAFWCALAGREDQLLFTVWFGGSEGTAAGTLTAADGSETEIRIAIAGFTPDKSWSDAQASLVYAMQEDINYLLGFVK